MNLGEIKTKAIDEIIELHRMQLNAISSATFANTEESLNEVLKCKDEYKSPSFFDVVDSIKREIALIKKSQKLVEALESIAAIGVVPDNCVEYFSTHDPFDLVDIVSTDTDLARQALKEWGEL